jgi:hypothetical protein
MMRLLSSSRTNCNTTQSFSISISSVTSRCVSSICIASSFFVVPLISKSLPTYLYSSRCILKKRFDFPLKINIIILFIGLLLSPFGDIHSQIGTMDDCYLQGRIVRLLFSYFSNIPIRVPSFRKFLNNQ